MNQQTKAQRLADELDLYATGDKHQRVIEDSAAELRRLDAVTRVQQLRVAELEGDLSEHCRLEALAFKQHDKIKSLLAINTQLMEALGEIEWSNNSQWQADRARQAINRAKKQT